MPYLAAMPRDRRLVTACHVMYWYVSFFLSLLHRLMFRRSLAKNYIGRNSQWGRCPPEVVSEVAHALLLHFPPLAPTRPKVRSCLLVFTEYVHNRLEREPLGDVFASTQSLAEFLHRHTQTPIKQLPNSPSPRSSCQLYNVPCQTASVLQHPSLQPRQHLWVFWVFFCLVG